MASSWRNILKLGFRIGTLDFAQYQGIFEGFSSGEAQAHIKPISVQFDKMLQYTKRIHMKCFAFYTYMQQSQKGPLVVGQMKAFNDEYWGRH